MPNRRPEYSLLRGPAAGLVRNRNRSIIVCRYLGLPFFVLVAGSLRSWSSLKFASGMCSF
jgi:hypothetical protein